MHRIEIIEEKNCAYAHLPECKPFYGMQLWGKNVNELTDVLEQIGFHLEVTAHAADNSKWYPAE